MVIALVNFVQFPNDSQNSLLFFISAVHRLQLIISDFVFLSKNHLKMEIIWK